MWSPTVWGSKSVSFGFSALRRIGTNCKRATRPCNCGYLGHHSGRCHCTPDQIRRYRGRISGPLLDRIDLHVEVPALRDAELHEAVAGESSAMVRARVANARAAQLARQGKPNTQLAGGEIERHCTLEVSAQKLLRDAASRLGLSARAFHRVLKVARTIADLGDSGTIRAFHVGEALQYRNMQLQRSWSG